MKKIYKILIILILLIQILTIKAYAHGGNITGWKDKNSSEVTLYNGKYYGYHNENGIRHYHQVEWDVDKQRWVITKTAVYYDEKFNIIEESVSDKEKKEVKFSSGVDGDTAKFEVDGEIITVRFLGINTPETVATDMPVEAFGKEASDYTKDVLQNAIKIELEYDEKAGSKDKYNRDLAWVWVNDSLIQEELVLNGLAKQYMLQANYKYAGKIQEAESVAKENKVGMWANNVEETSEENEAKIDIKKYGAGTITIMLLLGIISTLFKKVKGK